MRLFALAPETICPERLTGGGHWVDLKGEGEIWSFAMYHRAMNPAFADEVSYAVAMVRLSDGIGMIGRIAAPPDRVSIGQKVWAVFVPITDEVTGDPCAMGAQQVAGGWINSSVVAKKGLGRLRVGCQTLLSGNSAGGTYLLTSLQR